MSQLAGERAWRSRSQTLAQLFLDYSSEFLNESSFHGVVYFLQIRRRPIEMLFWLVCWGCTLCGATAVILSNWNRFQENPTVISMDKNFMDFNTTFPAMTTCQLGVYNKTKANAFIDKQWGNVTPKKRAYYLSFLDVIANISYDHLHLFKNFLHDPTVPQRGYYDILKQISKNQSASVEGLEATIAPQMSHLGLCHTINSAFVNYIHDRRKVHNGNRKIKDVLMKTRMTRSEDGVAWMSMHGMDSVTNYYLHSPFEFPDVTTHREISIPWHLTETMFSVLEILPTPGLKILDSRQRRCLFPDESNLEISTIYSYSLCRTECRMKMARRLCGCSPFFYPLVDSFTECDLAGLFCLSQYKDNLRFITDPVTNKPDKTCKCMTTCNIASYSIIRTLVASWDETSQYLWQMAAAPRVQLQRSVLYGPVDLLVSFGGTVGFFLGCSLLSGVEVIYFYTLRLIWYMLRARQKRSSTP